MNNWKYGAVDFDEEKAVILMHFDGPKRAIRCEQVDYATGSYTPCTMKFLKYPTAWIQLHIRLDEKYSYYIEKRHYSTPLCTRIVLVGAEKLSYFQCIFFLYTIFQTAYLQNALRGFYQYFEHTKNQQIFEHHGRNQSPDALMGNLFRTDIVYDVDGKNQGESVGVVFSDVGVM